MAWLVEIVKFYSISKKNLCTFLNIKIIARIAHIYHSKNKRKILK